MKIFLDSANLDHIRKFKNMGLLDGITTNPSILSKEGENPSVTLTDIVNLVRGDISIEVLKTNYDDIIKEALHLHNYGPNVVIKVPLTYDGLRACQKLSSDGISVNVTLVFSASQAILAAKLGAKYVSPFIGRLDDISHDGMNLIRDIKTIFSNYNYSTQILVASIRHPLHVIDAAKIGVDVVTVPPAILDKMIQHPLSDIGLKTFLSDWEKLRTTNPYANL